MLVVRPQISAGPVEASIVQGRYLLGVEEKTVRDQNDQIAVVPLGFNVTNHAEQIGVQQRFTPSKS
jgi:hypothetical protein